MPDLETAEFAAYADAFRAAPEICKLAEIGGASCTLVPGLGARVFNRVVNLQSTAPLDELAANIGGRPAWSCYVAYDGEEPAGAGALFVHGDVGWLGFAATRPRLRGRGAQSAILAARIEDARKQGCSTVTTETGAIEEGRPSNSYRNILRAGFREAGVRANYRAP